MREGAAAYINQAFYFIRSCDNAQELEGEYKAARRIIQAMHGLDLITSDERREYRNEACETYWTRCEELKREEAAA